MGTANQFLESIADFIKPSVTSKEIEHNGKKETFHFREMSGEEGTAIFGDFTSSDTTKKDAAMRALRNRSVASGLCDENGNKVVSEAQVAKWPLALLNKLHAAVMEHNGVVAKDDKAEVGNE